jgi:DNA replication licensing factor MCM3
MQTVVIQELPEMAPPGLLPQSVTVVLQGSLVNSVKPGDRVQMVGIYKLVAGAQSKEKGIFRPYFICLSVKQLSETSLTGSIPNTLPFNNSEIAGICSRSVAPSIYGHE